MWKYEQGREKAQETSLDWQIVFSDLTFWHVYIEENNMLHKVSKGHCHPRNRCLEKSCHFYVFNKNRNNLQI